MEWEVKNNENDENREKDESPEASTGESGGENQPEERKGLILRMDGKAGDRKQD